MGATDVRDHARQTRGCCLRSCSSGYHRRLAPGAQAQRQSVRDSMVEHVAKSFCRSYCAAVRCVAAGVVSAGARGHVVDRPATRPAPAAGNRPAVERQRRQGHHGGRTRARPVALAAVAQGLARQGAVAMDVQRAATGYLRHHAKAAGRPGRMARRAGSRRSGHAGFLRETCDGPATRGTANQRGACAVAGRLAAAVAGERAAVHDRRRATPRCMRAMAMLRSARCSCRRSHGTVSFQLSCTTTVMDRCRPMASCSSVRSAGDWTRCCGRDTLIPLYIDCSFDSVDPMPAAA
jgi:hypothetical protein